MVSRLAETVGEEAGVGVADGLFAAVLAARSALIVPPGGTADFLGPWSVATLARPDLAVTLQRLGVTTLGQLAALPGGEHLGPLRGGRGRLPCGGPGRER